MSLLVFGLSHLSAPVSVLERVSLSSDDRAKLVGELLTAETFSEAMMVSTCNRVELYAVIEGFHPALELVSAQLSERTGISVAELTQHAYVHYADAAVEHLFAVSAGLDSMVVGEQQILGQVREAYVTAQAEGTAGPILHGVAQQALRTGKRVRTETGIDTVGASVVSVGLERVHALRGSFGPLDKAVVVGSGAMGSLTAHALAEAGVRDIVLLNRTVEAAQRLAHNVAAKHGITPRVGALSDLITETSDTDALFTVTGAMGTVVSLADAHSALAARRNPAPLLICDLGLPRDVEPAIAGLPEVHIVDLSSIARDAAAQPATADAGAARDIVAGELQDYLDTQRQAEVTPTVTALRSRAAEVVEAELLRLQTRLPDLDDGERDEVAKTVRRVVDKLLHAPTVRVKQLAATGKGEPYAEALRELFELKPGAAEAVSAPERTRPTYPTGRHA